MLNVGAFVEPCKDPRASVVSRVEQKKGLLGRDRGVGLSVKGQVDELIKAATCKRNLSEMYVGDAIDFLTRKLLARLATLALIEANKPPEDMN